MRLRHRKFTEGKVYVHKVIWELCNFEQPKGLMIHHIDGDIFNNTPENLVLVTRTEHGKAHKRLNDIKRFMHNI